MRNVVDIFVSVPSDSDRRNEWIKAIEQHQIFNYKISKFYVCELHFSPESIYRNGARVTVKKGFVPTIFPQM